MRHIRLPAFGLASTLVLSLGLAACGPGLSDQKVQEAIASANAAEQGNINELMLSVADPNDAVTYFRNATDANPADPVLKRYLARALLRAGKSDEAVKILTDLVAQPTATDDDRLALADAQIRSGDWKGAEATLNAIPPTVETYDRYRLEALVADSRHQWKKADSFYEIAAGLTPQPANIYNNWGFSKLQRGDAAGAEKLFREALSYDPTMFTAKNNLVLARAAQRNYDLPVVDMSQDERAKLLYTAALAAIKQGDVAIGKQLLQQAIDTSPTYFEAAARSLAALEGSG
jgi:Flp pilus assembly protein TadD